MIRISWGIQWATLEPCKYYSRFKRHHFLFALSKTTFCSSYFRCDASQDGSALWIILFSRVDSFHSPKVTLYTCIFELGPNIWHWKIPTLQACFSSGYGFQGGHDQEMDSNTLFTKRMYSGTKNIGLLSKMKAFLDFMQNPESFMGS